MKIAILIEDHYQVLEAWYPYFRLQEEWIETVFVGTGQHSYKSKEQQVLSFDYKERSNIIKNPELVTVDSEYSGGCATGICSF